MAYILQGFGITICKVLSKVCLGLLRLGLDFICAIIELGLRQVIFKIS